MTTWFVSRHPGAVAWAKNQNLAIDVWPTHLNVESVHPGDVVIGTLPFRLAADICAKGARFFCLEIEVTEDLRGKELSQETLKKLHCKLTEFVVTDKGVILAK